MCRFDAAWWCHLNDWEADEQQAGFTDACCILPQFEALPTEKC